MTDAVDSRQAQLPGDRAARAERGRSERTKVSLDDQAAIAPRRDVDPLAILAAQDAQRLPDLVPLRYGRMAFSPFAFYRGAAAVMAADLAAEDHTELYVQLCGDAHVANFGGFAAPDRRLVIDVNDFDETLPGPFEWDVKRLVGSIVVAATVNGCPPKIARELGQTTARWYRGAMAVAAALDPLTLWYQRIELDDFVSAAHQEAQTRAGRKAVTKAGRKAASKASSKSHLGALSKLTEVHDGQRRFLSRPPLLERIPEDDRPDQLAAVSDFFAEYSESLPPERRTLLARFRLTDVARKVVGVGSVGTRCYVALLETDDGEPLFLQLKEATASVLEAHLGPADQPHHGQRVVEGQRLIQGAPDPLLGWADFNPPHQPRVSFYVRQLWDGKLSADLDAMDARQLSAHGRLCAVVLARAHARTGDATAIAGYLGPSETFDEAMATWARRYAKRTRRDHAELVAAIAGGAIEAQTD